MTVLKQCLAIGGAGFLGALARFFVARFCGWLFTTTFPVGTLVINLSGSLLLGWFLTAAGNRFVVSDTLRLAIGVGFVGAYTTFSTFMYESSRLFEDGEKIKAMTNLVGSLVLGLVFVQLGIRLAGGK